ncbi:hypothetical protein ACFL6F_03125 [Planctomycetota bacterium]
MYYKKYKKIQKYLSKISVDNTWYIDILPYHPNGAELLMKMLDNTNEDIDTRINIVDIIKLGKVQKAFPGLKRYEYDKTPVEMYQGHPEYQKIYNTFGDVCRSAIWLVKGEDANTIIEYLSSEDNDAIEQAAFWLATKAGNIQKEYDKKERDNIEKSLKNLLLSKNDKPEILHWGLKAATYNFQGLFKISEVMAAIHKGIEIYNKRESEKLEGTEKNLLILKKINNYYDLGYKEIK